VLPLNIPVGVAAVNGEVYVTIEAAGPKQQTITEQEEWRQFISSTASAWRGDLERPEHGEYEKRDELDSVPRPSLPGAAQR
jgi:hypothetical protein